MEPPDDARRAGHTVWGTR